MRPLRVLHVTPYFADAWAYGGIPRLATALARGLAGRGHAVTVCTTDACCGSHRLTPPAARPRFRRWPAEQTSDGVTLQVFPNLSNHLAYRWQLFLPLGLGHFLRTSAASFDVAHLHACRNVPGAIAAAHLTRAGVPYVLAPNGTALRIERRRTAKRIFDAVAGTRVVRGAARLLAVSDAERSQLRSVGVEPHEIRVVPNPIDLREFNPPPERGAFRRRTDDASGPLVLFLGRITARKRIDVVVRAFAQVKRMDARLAIAGNDMGPARRARRLARAADVADRTVFTGLLRGRDRLEALADADVLVYPSQDEIFGLVPLEALLCGTPVIVADDSGCAEIVRAVGGGQTVPVGDAGALARAIDNVLDNPARWRAAAADAAVRVRAAYAPEVVCAQLDDVYRELVGAS